MQQLGARRALLAIMTICSLLALPQAAKADTDGQYWSETGHTAQGWYWRFWQNTPNALRVLGYPISEPFMAESFTEPGKQYRVQYFERAVLEEHPENFGRDDNQFYIQARLLGNELITGREGETPFQPVPQPATTAEQAWFAETQHTLRNDPTTGPFKTFWERYGGLPVFGYPISEPFQEQNADTGETYWVQYFERNRFEFHPDQQPDFQVLLGRLGAQYAQQHPDRVDQDAFRPRPVDESLPAPFIYGANVRGYYTDQPRLQSAVKAGFETNNTSGETAWIRQQVPWKDHMRADGTIAWGELDTVVNAAAANGVKVFLGIAKSPSWATDNGGDGLPNRANWNRFAQFLGAITERYQGKVYAIEIWNEQNYAVENGGRVAPAEYYVDLLEVAYDAIKAVDPYMIVVAGAPTPTATNKVEVAIDDLIYFQQMFAIPKFWNKMDVVGAHFAGTLNPPDALPEPNRPISSICDTWNTNTEFYFRRAEGLRDAMIRAGHADRQVWITEMGWATQNTTPGYEYGNCVSLEQQAQYLERAIGIARHSYAPWVGGIFVWNMNFAVSWAEAGDPLHEQAAFGILNTDWSPRPAFTAIQNMPKP